MLNCQNLHKTFHPDHNPLNDRKALDGVSLRIEDGDFVAVIGSNGSGKTTLLNLIAGVYQPDEGEIYLNGRRLDSLKEHKRAAYIGRVFQDPLMGSIADISIFENLSLAEARSQRPYPFAWAFSKAKRDRYEKLLAGLGLGLEKRLDERVGTLSGGQRQSLTLLMATLNQPQLLLLDEHTAALDPKTAKTVMALTEKIVQEGHIPTLMITHNLKDAIRYGNRLIMMSEGQIAFEVSGKEKAALKVEDLLAKFIEFGGGEAPDSVVLS